jgi:7-cyano-7-deazaguanine reductase
VTAQPDWASVLVRYRGPAIDRGSLLRYLVSFRRHQAFHETTIEQIFLDLKERCRCEKLVVGGYFLRRGGLDINPFRADPGEHWPVIRLARQ